MKKIILLITLLVCASVPVFSAENVHDIKVLAGNERFFDVSLSDINLLKFPYDVKEVKTSKKLSMTIEKSNVFLSMGAHNQPVELFVVFNTKELKTVNIILVPKRIPSKTLTFFDSDKKNDAIVDAEKSLPYEVALRNMILAAKDNSSDGYFSKKIQGNHKKTSQLFLQQIKELAGYRFRLEVWEVKNISGENLYLEETDFYVHGMRALSLDTNKLDIDKSTKLYIVYRTND